MRTASAFLAVVQCVGVVCLAACASSPPMHFYTLSTRTEPRAAGGAAEALPPIQVARVTLPGEIDRSELVQRIDDNRLRLADNDLWAAPLGAMIARTLAEDLRARGARGSGEPERLTVDLEEFIGDARCTVTLRASWSLESPNRSTPPIRGHESIQENSAGECSVGVLPQVMSRALAELADRIAVARMAPRQP